MKKKWLALIFALMMGLTIGVSQASAQVEISPGTIGDVLLFSLYDLREDDGFRTDNWDNFIVIENTSGNWTAVHLRFRAYKKSIEVWDHVILLSPYDMFWADLVRTPGVNGGVTIWSNDENTLRNSGLMYGDTPAAGRFWEDTFKTDLMVQCGFDDDLSETEMGEIEVIGLWSLEIADDGDDNPATLPNGVEDTHVLSEVVRDVYRDPSDLNDTVNVYDVMFALYYEFDPVQTDFPTIWKCQQPPQPNTDLFWNAGWETYVDAEVWINECEAPQGVECDVNGDCDGLTRQALDCGNVLSGAFEMGDIGNGRYELQNFVVFRDFRTDTTWTGGRTDIDDGLHRDRFGGGEIVFPPTVMSTNMSVAAYTGFPADGRFSDSGNTNIPAYYLNESWSSTHGPGLRDGDNVMVYDSPLVAAFNDIWSLDDVENALEKDSVWFHYFNDFFYDPGEWDFRYITDMSVSFPTKHYHWFFEGWPWWQEPYPVQTVAEYTDAVHMYRHVIEFDFDYKYENGRVIADSRIWNDNEDLYVPDPDSEPSPVTHENVTIPHEVNYIRVQTTDEDGLLYIDPALVNLVTGNYTVGHFQITDIKTTNGQRSLGFAATEHPIYKPTDATAYPLYPVGAVTFLNYHVNAAGAADGLVRSTLSNWHYAPVVK